MITYAEAKKLLAKYQGRGGKCPTSPEIDLFVRQVLEYLLFNGEYGNIRKFVFRATRGCFTVPYELEVPLKVKLDNKVASSWDRWFEWSSARELGSGAVPASDALFEDPNYYPTVYDIPPGGTRVGVLGLCSESSDSHIIVQGTGIDGREIFTTHKGESIAGEYISIRRGELRYSSQVFARITGVTKSKTNGYVQLLWVIPSETLDTKGFLSEYSPVEEKPAYRRYRLDSKYCKVNLKVSVLGRIRLKTAYADNDIIPFDSLNALELAGQMINSRFNKDFQSVQAQTTLLQDIITKENEYKRVQVGQPLEVYPTTSAGSIRNII